MDQQLKARLIGASVLVLLAVLLIPELLSARKPAADSAGAATSSNGTRTIVIDLSGAVNAGARVAPLPAAPKPRSAPPAAIEESATKMAETSTEKKAEVAPTPVAKMASAAVEPKPAPQSTPSPAKATPTASEAPVKIAKAAPTASEATIAKAPATTGRWAVQVGAFGSSASASKLIGELQRAGYSAYEAPINRSGKTLHRVRVGPEAERADADRLSARLKGRGLPATVVPND